MLRVRRRKRAYKFVMASEAKQSMVTQRKHVLLRRYAPRNDECRSVLAPGDPKIRRSSFNNSRIVPCATASLPDRRTRLDKIAYVNGSFVPMADAKVSVLDRGFLFSDGIYEIAAVLEGKMIDNASHLTRLQRSAGELEL